MRSVGYETVNGELHVRRTEIALKNRRDRTSDAASADGGYRPPETEGKFSVPAADGGVRESGPQHGHQPRAIGSVEAPLCCQSPESAAVLLAGVLGPEKTNLCLPRGANRAVQGAERFHLVVVVDPLLAVECIGTFVGEELCRSGHGERLRLPEPRRYRRREGRRGSLVKTRPDGRSVRKIDQQAVARTRVDQSLRRCLADGNARGNVCGRVGNGSERRRQVHVETYLL